MKKLIRTFATLLIGMALGASTLAAAAPQTVQAVLTKFNVVVNGEKQELKNTPVVIQGATYLPVREVAGLLDADLTFDSKTQKIELNTKGETKVTETVQSTEWVSLRELHETYKLTVSQQWFTEIKDGDKLLFTIKKSENNYEASTPDGKIIGVKSTNDGTLINKGDLKELGIIN